ncbi:dTDP-4-dehydrorhamnose reductase [Alkanindiges illinoisensis]|uniref:dTDP-4-dehydrorhamnose reductase n=1 Tax=Alkanindiges illinoisensis TaxID=197183 RepID=UPI00047E2F46|nr:dTDP-4-dehydrorhamnose reductase [Alkanindiges illinoisensis]
MKILLFGKNGQVGWELQRALAPLGELIALDRHSQLSAEQPNGHTAVLCGDLSNIDAVRATIITVKPDVVINAAAYTAVDKAESAAQDADIINHLAVKAIAEACQQISALLVHYSTDYVFDGQGTQIRREDDSTDPLNVYGKTKRAGELAILASGCQTLIFRTSWVYATRGNNFIRTMLHLAHERDELSIINDQIGAPTSAALIADVTAHALKTYANAQAPAQLCGIYHLTAAGSVSWYGYAQFIFKQASHLGYNLKIKQVNPIDTSAYPTPAQRPLNSRLSLAKLEQQFGLMLPHWQQSVLHTLQEIIEGKTEK